MDQNTNGNLDARISYVLEKLREEYEIIKRQGFPSRKYDYYSQFSRQHDSKIAETRWRSWLNELGIDYLQFEEVLKILKNEGLLEKFEFISEFR